MKDLWDRKQRIIFIGLITLFVCAIFIGGYLYSNTFEIEYHPKTLLQQWEEEGISENRVINGKRIETDIPKNVANTELILLIGDFKGNIRYHIEQVDLDTEKGRLNMNGKLFGIPFPLSILFKPTIEGNLLKLPFEQIQVGEQGVSLSKSQSDKLSKYLLRGSETLDLDLSALYNTSILSLMDVTIESKELKLGIEVNDKLIKVELSKVRKDLNEDIFSSFENSQDPGEKAAYHFIEDVDKLTEEDIQILTSDILLNSDIISNILICANHSAFEDILKRYGGFFHNFERADLMQKKGALLTQVLKPYYHEIIDRLMDEYFRLEPLLINKGQPYMLSEKIQISLEKVVKEKGILVPPRTLERMDFCYDFFNQRLLISYKLDNQFYLLMSDSEYTILDEKAFSEEYSYENTGRADYIKDIKTWDSIYEELSSYFQTDEMFIRYMKSDDEYAFVIASPKYNYQSYWAFAFKKNNQKWEILEENVDKLGELNRKYPDFNLETATLEIETVTMYNLPEDMYDVILEDMVDKEMIRKEEGLRITYCSYGNQYIDFMLSDGQEYVYMVTGVYLNKVLKKEEAVETFKDLPDIITLQDPPENEARRDEFETEED